MSKTLEGPLPPLSGDALAMIEQWVRLADAVGFPRSYAQIYGFLFVSNKPVNAQDCVEALKISRSSAGQGLKVLRDLGAIRSNFELGGRAETFSIEPDLGVLVKSVLDGKLLPAFDTFFGEMGRLESQLNPSKDGFQINRIQKLNRWRSKLGKARKWLFL